MSSIQKFSPSEIEELRGIYKGLYGETVPDEELVEIAKNIIELVALMSRVPRST